MAVRAHDLALLDLCLDSCELVLLHQDADAGILVTEVVELQHHDVGLAAVNARVRRRYSTMKARFAAIRALERALIWAM